MGSHPKEAPPYILMGSLTLKGKLLLTISADARKQSEHYYELLQNFPLQRQ